MAGGAQVENGEAAEPEAEVAVQVHPGVIGPAVDDGVHHPANLRFGDGLVARVMEGSANAAHKAGGGDAATGSVAKDFDGECPPLPRRGLRSRAAQRRAGRRARAWSRSSERARRTAMLMRSDREGV